MADFYSPSNLKTFACPYKWKQIYKEGRRFEAGEPAQIGKDLHSAIDAHLTDKEHTFKYPDAKIMFESFLDHGWPLINEENILMVEELLRCEIDGADLGGYPDLVTDEGNNVAYLWDWKTDRRVRSHEEVENDPQLKFYAALLANEYPYFTAFRCRLVFVRYKCTVREFTITRQEALDYLETIMMTVKRIEDEEEFKPVPSSECSFCQFYEECSDKINMPIAPVLDTPSSAKNIVNLLIYFGKIKKEYETILKKYASDNGSITSGGMTYGFNESCTPKIKATPAEIIDRLPHLAPDVLQPVGAAWLKKKKNADIAAELESAGMIGENISTRWGAKKEGK